MAETPLTRGNEDLPDPVPLPQGDEAREARRWRLVTSFVFFAVAYSQLHKWMIPLALRATPLAASPYARTDPTFWLGLALALERWLRPARLTRIGCLLGGMLVGDAVVQTALVIDGRFVGWLVFSHLLASIPLALAAIALLSMPKRGGVPGIAWVGALVGAALSASLELIHETPTTSTPKSHSAQTTAPLVPNALCGAMQLHWNAGESGQSDPILASDCGFHPARVQLGVDGRIRLRNERLHVVNLRASIIGPSGLRRSWNLPVLPGAEMLAPPLSLHADEAAVIVSDVNPELGLVLALPPNAVPAEWSVQRQPWSWSRSP